MFDLDRAVDKWCKDLGHNGHVNEEELVELHDHLLCIIEEAQSEGIDDKRAFKIASNKIGLSRQIGNEYLKVGFLERLRRLPKALVAIALIITVGGLIDLPNLYGALYEADFYNAFGYLLSISFPALVSYKLLYLRRGWRKFVLFVNGVYLFFTGLTIVIISVVISEGIPGKIKITGDLLANLSEETAAFIAFAFSIVMFALLIWSFKTLTRPDVLMLFNLELDESGRPIRRGIKTFKWLPY